MVTKILIVIGVLLLVFIAILLWCCLRVAARSDGIDIMLYKNDVTLQDCLDMKEKYGMSTILNDGEILGFSND